MSSDSNPCRDEMIMSRALELLDQAWENLTKTTTRTVTTSSTHWYAHWSKEEYLSRYSCSSSGGAGERG